MLNGRPLNLLINKCSQIKTYNFDLKPKKNYKGKKILFFSSGKRKYINKCSKHLFIEISFGEHVCFWKYCHCDTERNRFYFHPVTVIHLCGFFLNVMYSHVYFNFYVNLAAPWYIIVKWKYILETMMNRFPSIRQTVPSNFLAYSLIYMQRHIHVI